MFLTITEPAQQRIEKAQSNYSGMLSVYYESKVGCECGNTGILTLRLSPEKETFSDGVLESNIGDLPIQEWTKDFLDSSLTLDYKPKKNTLILKGESGLINANVIITNEKGEQIL